MTPNGNGKTESFTFIDLFAGIGGMRKAFEHPNVGGKCVYTCEIDKYARQTYSENFSVDHEFEGDINDVLNPKEEVPDHDLLLGGFPCQPFSLAGVSKKNSMGMPHGFECETQGTLFHRIVEILEAKQPLAFLLENVKNLRSHDRGRTIEVIRKRLNEVGYDFDPDLNERVIDAKGYVPQHRERIFLAAFRKDLKFSVEEKFSLQNVCIAHGDGGPVLGDILHSPSDENQDIRFVDESGRVREKYIMTDHLWSYLQSYAEKHRLKGNGFGFSKFGTEDVARTLSARYHKDGSEILIKRPGTSKPRRLTPRECSRLMGFDECGEKPFILPDYVSDTQLYRQFGNALVVPVVRAIGEEMKDYIRDAKHTAPPGEPRIQIPIRLKEAVGSGELVHA